MVLSNKQHVEFLGSLFPFNLLDQASFQHVVQLFESVQFPAGTPIYQRDDLVDSFYLIITGNVRVSGDGKALSGDTRELGVGECFGEEALKASGLRQMDAVCKTQVDALIISRVEIAD